jgi:hypothetical protein
VLLVDAPLTAEEAALLVALGLAVEDVSGGVNGGDEVVVPFLGTEEGAGAIVPTT